MEITSLETNQSLVRQSNEPMSLLVRAGAWELALISRKNPLKTSGNEDCLVVVNLGERGLMLAVADGAGGYPQADRASLSVCEAIAKYVIDQAELADEQHGLREWVPGAIDHASSQVKEKAPLGRTTLTVAVLTGNFLRSYQVGDSELMALGLRGKVKHRTQSHSPVGYAVASGELDEEEALHHPDRHLVSNFLGDEHCRVEVSSPVELREKDTLLLASDGLFDNFLADELIEKVRKGSIKARTLALRDRIDQNFSDQGEKALKFDDVTVIIAKRAFESSSLKS